MAMQWHLRAGREEDIRAMYMLDLVCFDEPFRFTLASMRQFVMHPGAVVFVAEWKARLIGFVVVHMVGKETAYVVTLDVAAEFRLCGVASSLIAEAEEAAARHGAKSMALHVHAGNEAAIHFYDRSGYTRGEACPAFYGAGLDGWVYTKPIGGHTLDKQR